MKFNSIEHYIYKGFCLKTKNSKNEKVFINICKSDEVCTIRALYYFKNLFLADHYFFKISPPKDITDEELIQLIDQCETENAAFHFRVPMSLGEPHSELDNCRLFIFCDFL